MKKSIFRFICILLLMPLTLLSCNQKNPLTDSPSIGDVVESDRQNILSETEIKFFNIPIKNGKIEFPQENISSIEIVESTHGLSSSDLKNTTTVNSNSRISKIIAFFEGLTLDHPKQKNEISFASGNTVYNFRFFVSNLECYNITVDNNLELFLVQDGMYYNINKDFSEFWQAIGYHVTIDRETENWDSIPINFENGSIYFTKDISLVEIDRKYYIGEPDDGNDTANIKHKKNIELIVDWLTKLTPEPYEGDMSNLVTLTIRVGFNDNTFSDFNFCLGSQGSYKVPNLTSVAIEINDEWYTIDEVSGTFVNELIVWE